MVELAGGEQAARRHQNLVQLVHHRGFADPGIAGHQNQLGLALCLYAVERRQKARRLALPPKERFRDQQTVRHVPSAEPERVDPPEPLPRSEAAAQIRLKSGGGLVARLRGLAEQFQNDVRKRRGDGCNLRVGPDRLPGDMAMHPFHRLGGCEGQRPRQQLIENDAQGIKIAARIDRAVHPPGLFRRHVSERAGDPLRRRRFLPVMRQAGGDAKPGQPHAAAGPVHQDVRRFQVLMDQAARMRLPDGGRERDGKAQKGINGQKRADHAVERPAAGILEHQRHPAALIAQLQRTGGPGRVEFGTQLIFVLQPLDDRRRRMVMDRRCNQNGRGATIEETSRKSHKAIAPELLDDVPGSASRRVGNLHYHKRILDRDGADRYDWFILDTRPI